MKLEFGFHAFCGFSLKPIHEEAYGDFVQVEIILKQ